MLNKSINTASYRRIKHVILLGLDVIAAAAALVAASILLADFTFSAAIFTSLKTALPLTIIAAAVICYATGVSRRVWRFFSVTDLATITMAAAIIASISFAALSFTSGSGVRLPMSFLFVNWLLLVAAMGCLRMARRMAPKLLRKLNEGAAGRKAKPRALIAGAPDSINAILCHARTGADSHFQIVGVLDESEIDLRRKICGVPICGGLEALNRIYKDFENKGSAPEKLIIAAGKDNITDPRYAALASRARDLGMTVMSAALSHDFNERKEVKLKPFDLSDLLGRAPAELDTAAIMRAVSGKCVLVTGAGGSIGGELCRQIAAIGPEKLILLDSGEYNLYTIDHDIQKDHPDAQAIPLLCDIRNRDAVMNAFAIHKPDIVFHSAALKHVPMVEQNPCAGVETNVLGTRNIADAAKRHGAEAMVQVSTDKAVNPIGVMGATKRLGELYCQALDLESRDGETRFMTVRFGNVLGSSGSVIPLFQRQLKERMPLTVTHRDMTRYFMTIHEAVQLILQSTQGALEKQTKRGRIFVLDMGKPIKVLDIAKRMIRLSGLQPDIDVKIEFVGTRPGEKLFEELFDAKEEQLLSEVPGIFEAEPAPIPLHHLEQTLNRLEDALSQHDTIAVRAELFRLISDDMAPVADENEAPQRQIVIAEQDSGPRVAAVAANDDIRLGA